MIEQANGRIETQTGTFVYAPRCDETGLILKTCACSDCMRVEF